MRVSLLFGLLWLVALTTTGTTTTTRLLVVATCYKINVGCLADVVAGRVFFRVGEKKERERGIRLNPNRYKRHEGEKKEGRRGPRLLLLLPHFTSLATFMYCVTSFLMPFLVHKTSSPEYLDEERQGRRRRLG